MLNYFAIFPLIFHLFQTLIIIGITAFLQDRHEDRHHEHHPLEGLEDVSAFDELQIIPKQIE